MQASADQIALQWADNMVDAAAQLNNLAPIFVSDWGKLSTAAANATGGDWTFSQQDLDGLGTSIEQGAAQTAYDSLMPVGYTTYQLCPNRIDPDPVSAGDYYAGSSPLGGVYQPFRGIPEAGQTMLLAVGPIGPVGTLYAMQAPPSTPFGGGAPLPSPSLNPPSSLVTPLFQSVNQSGGIGLYPPYFWERYMLPPDLFLSDDYPPAKTCPPLTSP